MLQSRLREIARRLEHETPREAQRAVGDVVVAGAKMRVPKITHTLERSIHAENVTEGDRHLVWVVADAHAPPPHERKSRGATEGAPYGHMVEFGTHRAAANPFLVPALEHGKPEMEAAVAALILKACE